MFEGVVIDVAIRTFLKSPSSPKSNIINFKVKLTFKFSQVADMFQDWGLINRFPYHRRYGTL